MLHMADSSIHQQFLVQALKHLPSTCSTINRELGSKLKDALKQQGGKVGYGVCSYCDTYLYPGANCTVRTISKRRIRKTSKRYRIAQHNPLKNHFIKVHCKVCDHTLLYSCGLNKDSKTMSTSTSTPVNSISNVTPVGSNVRSRQPVAGTGKSGSRGTTPNTQLAVGKPYFTPKRRRSSLGLKAILKQSTPATPPSTPSLQDFLISS